MANIAIGDADCTVNDVLRAFNESSIQNILMNEWSKLCLHLDTPLNTMETIRNDLLWDKINIMQVINSILIEWKSRKSDEATLGNLLDIVGKTGEWKLLQGKLQQLVIHKAKSWNDLDTISKGTALQSKVAFQGKIQTLSSLQGSMTSNEFDSFLNSQIEQKNIPKLFKGGVVSLGRVQNNKQTNQQQNASTNSKDPQPFSSLQSSLTSPASVLRPVTDEERASTSNLRTEPYNPKTHQFPLTDTVIRPSNTTQSSGFIQPPEKEPQAISTEPTQLEPEPQKLESTEQIKYFKSDVLGVGSGGTNVYKGTFGQRDVAVKVISNFKDESEAKNETKILLQCDKHENIVRYIHSEMTTDGFLICLELCEKFTLADWVDDSTCISVSIEPLEVLRQATEGLGFLHQPKINIVHRDLKPSNILFLIRGSEAVVKISDFGISRSISPGRNTRTVTRFGGTSGWTAAEMLEVESIFSKTRRPQAVENIPKMTNKIDIFSLGCIYYFVLTKGEHPFGDNERLRDHLIETNKNILDTINLPNYDLRLRCNLSLLKNMIDKDPKIRPDVTYILSHPFFWSYKKMIDFIDEVSNFVNKPTPENESLCVSCVDKLERNYFPQISNGEPDGWFSLLDSTLKPNFTRRYKTHKDKAIMLVRILRNYKHHYHEKDFEPEVKNHIGEMPNDFMIYWLGFFPTLINEMRDAFLDLKLKSNFEDYY